MAFFCCAPAVLLMVNFRLARIEYMHMETKLPSWYDFQAETIGRSFLLYTSGMQTLIQAGCHPMICAAAAASLTAASVSMPLGEMDFSPVVIQSALAWLLVVSHLIDFFARMRAIERGMQQSHQNAASAQRLLGFFRCSLGKNSGFYEPEHMLGPKSWSLILVHVSDSSWIFPLCFVI